MILKTLRWLGGYAFFRASGGCPEKFINLAVKNNINIWDLKKTDGDLYGKVNASEYKNLIKSTRRSNCKIKSIKKSGLPFFVFKRRKRAGIIAGALAFLAMMFGFSRFVWSVNIYGNADLSSERIRSVLSELGVVPGSVKKNIDATHVMHEAMIKLPEVSWMAVNVEGGGVNVIIKEKIHVPEIVSQGEPCNIIAETDGVITRMETYKGTPVLSAGDVVAKGQLIISGVTEGPSGENTFVSSDGKVIATTRRVITQKIKMNQIYARDTGKITKKYYLIICGRDFHLWGFFDTGDSFRREEYQNKIRLFGKALPVGFRKEIWHEQECSEKKLTPQEASSEVNKMLKEYQTSEMTGVNIEDCSSEEAEENGEYILTAVLTCSEDISKKEKISFES